MNKFFIIVFISSLWGTGFSQNLLPRVLGNPFSGTNFVVKWEAPKNALPSKAWVYDLLRNQFSQKAVSDLMAMGSFTDKDKTHDTTNAVILKSKDGARNMYIFFEWGTIDYRCEIVHSHTNLVEDVPDETQMRELTRQFLSQLRINPLDISKNPTNSKPDFHFFASTTIYYGNHTFTRSHLINS